MADADDPYFKLKPPPPTLAEEICACEGRPPLSVYRSFGPNPLHCLACNREVAPERVGFSAELAEELAEWRDLYAAFDTLWLDSGEFEDWARVQLADPDSAVNQRGLEVIARLAEHVLAYLTWFQEPGEDDFVPLTECPRCGEDLTTRCEALVCEGCHIEVSN